MKRSKMIELINKQMGEKGGLFTAKQLLELVEGLGMSPPTRTVYVELEGVHWADGVEPLYVRRKEQGWEPEDGEVGEETSA
jgi:hypothetical protein